MTTFTALGDSITLGVGDPVRQPTRSAGLARLGGPARREPARARAAQPGAPTARARRTSPATSYRRRWPASRRWPAWCSASTTRCGLASTRRRSRPRPRTPSARCARPGAEVLTMRLPDSGWMLGLPDALAKPLARRTARGQRGPRRGGAAVRHAALRRRRHPGHLREADVGGRPAASERARPPADRAGRSTTCCDAAGLPVGPAPDAEPENPPPTRWAEFAWMATKGTAWVLKRSTDLVPYLIAMAIRETWSPPRGGPGHPGRGAGHRRLSDPLA